jgi:hypothetical protein
MSIEKVVATRPEVQRLLDAGFIREVEYPSWPANVIMVMKKNNKWRMCYQIAGVSGLYCRLDGALGLHRRHGD